MDRDLSEAIAQQVAQAAAERRPLRIRGGDSKYHLGPTVEAAELLEVGDHRGIIHYQPTELVITARAGTPLAEVEAALAECGQYLPFEPPHLGATATLGGTLACALSGPRRPYVGAARDFLLGSRVVNGRGDALRFGGEVMKNVAGYDASRLMVGARGTLGVILEASLKVLPRPEQEQTLTFECDAELAITWLNRWAGAPLPLSGGAHHQGRLYVRLSGVEAAVSAAKSALGGEALAELAAERFWSDLREQRLPLFSGEISDEPGSVATSPSPPSSSLTEGGGRGRLWRLSLPPAAPLPQLHGEWLIDWGGAQRWLISDSEPAAVRAAAIELGGHATSVRATDGEGLHQPLSPSLFALHQRIKERFDPNHVLNPGGLYSGL